MILFSICKSSVYTKRLRTIMTLFILLFIFSTNLPAQIESISAIKVTSVECDLEVNLGDIIHHCDGSEVCFTIENGVLPYTVLIDGEQAPPNIDALNFCIDGLSPGFYVITVTDGAGCTASLEVAIPFIDYYLEANITNVSCYGGSDGAIQPFIYIDPILYFHWEGPDGFTADTEAISGLLAGEYHLEVTWPDGNCYFTGSWTVGQPEPINIEVVVEYPECGAPDACLFISGGTAPYHLWVFETLPPVFQDSPYGMITDWTSLDPNGGIPYDPSTTNTPYCAEDVPNGIYYILVIDSNLCYAWEVVTIEANPFFSRTLEITHAGCNGQGGSVCYQIEGGTPPLGTWISPSVTDEVLFGPEGCFDNLAPGTYTITTEDGNGCTLSETFTIEGSGDLEAYFEITSEPCSDQVDGCLYVEGGTLPYNIWVWQWTVTSDVLPTVVFDDNGNPYIENTQLTDVFNWQVEPNTTPDYIRCAEDIPPGWYLILVVDANGCYDLLPVHIPHPNNLEATFEITSQDCDQVDGCLTVTGGTMPYHLWVWAWNSPLTVIPNVLFDAGGNPYIEGATPTEVIQWQPEISPNDTYVRCAEDIPPGYYLVLVVDANGCWVLLPVLIPDTSGFDVNITATDVSCMGQGDGSIKVAVEGGAPPYTIVLGDMAILSDEGVALFENLYPGTYTVSVVDANGCSKSITVIIGESDGIISNLDFDQYGEYACVDPEGGTAPYTIHWYQLGSNFGWLSNECIFDLEHGAYLVTIVDVNGCTSQDIFFIDEPECAAGEAYVNPEQIDSGESTVFTLENHYGNSIQWQFKTEVTGWLNIPGATSDVYQTPPIHSGSDKVVLVRALVVCDGETLISTEAEFKVFADEDLMELAASIEDQHLFDPGFRQQELATLDKDRAHHDPVIQVFPNPAGEFLMVDFRNKINHHTQLTLFNVYGALVFSRNVEPGFASVQEISTTDLMNGIYFLNIQTDAGTEVRKIIVEH